MKQATPRLGQVAITVNGECCPRAESKSAEVNFTQRVFELEGGPMTGMPGMEQLPNPLAVYERAIAWLEEMKRKAVSAALDG